MGRNNARSDLLDGVCAEKGVDVTALVRLAQKNPEDPSLLLEAEQLPEGLGGPVLAFVLAVNQVNEQPDCGPSFEHCRVGLMMRLARNRSDADEADS